MLLKYNELLIDSKIYNLNKIKRLVRSHNLNLNCIHNTGNPAFILFLNFINPDFYKLSSIFLTFLNTKFQSVSSSFFFVNSGLQKTFFNTSSGSYLFYFNNVCSLFLFLDFLLRLKINFFIKGVLDLQSNSLLSIFTLVQFLNSRITFSQKNDFFLIYNYFCFYYPVLLKILFFLKQVFNSNVKDIN